MKRSMEPNTTRWIMIGRCFSPSAANVFQVQNVRAAGSQAEWYRTARFFRWNPPDGSRSSVHRMHRLPHSLHKAVPDHPVHALKRVGSHLPVFITSHAVFRTGGQLYMIFKAEQAVNLIDQFCNAFDLIA